MREGATVGLIVQALWELLRYDVTLKAGGFERVHASLRRVRRGHNPGSVREATITAAMKGAMSWYWRPALCLQRSVAATRLLRRNGFAAELVIGYRPEPFMTHAWVEIEGRVVNDAPAYQQYFHTLERV